MGVMLLRNGRAQQKSTVTATLIYTPPCINLTMKCIQSTASVSTTTGMEVVSAQDLGLFLTDPTIPSHIT